MSRAYLAELVCPHCGGSRSFVKNTTGNKAGDRILRRRECAACKDRFTTVELIPSQEAAAVLDKLCAGLRRLRSLMPRVGR